MTAWRTDPDDGAVHDDDYPAGRADRVDRERARNERLHARRVASIARRLRAYREMGAAWQAAPKIIPDGSLVVAVGPGRSLTDQDLRSWQAATHPGGLRGRVLFVDGATGEVLTGRPRHQGSWCAPVPGTARLVSLPSEAAA